MADFGHFWAPGGPGALRGPNRPPRLNMVKDWGFGPNPAKNGQKGVPNMAQNGHFGPYLGPPLGRPSQAQYEVFPRFWPKMAQNGPKRGPKYGPKWPILGHSGTPYFGTLKMDPRNLWGNGPKWPKVAKKGSQKGAQNRSKWPKMAIFGIRASQAQYGERLGFWAKRGQKWVKKGPKRAKKGHFG